MLMTQEQGTFFHTCFVNAKHGLGIHYLYDSHHYTVVIADIYL